MVSQAGLQNLLQILLTRGVVDPGYTDRRLIENRRSTDADVHGIQRILAERGLTGAGEGLGLQTAAYEAGSTRAKDIVSEDVRRGEDRNMQALALLMQLFGSENQRGALNLANRQFSYSQDQDSLNRILSGLGNQLPYIIDAIFGGRGGNRYEYESDDPSSIWYDETAYNAR
jgi:hypothetical protein